MENEEDSVNKQKIIDARARNIKGMIYAGAQTGDYEVLMWSIKGKHNRRERNPLAIVMAPTREFARQVGKEFYKSAPELYTLCVYGGSPIQCQMSTLDRGVDVTVGTPGRVIDLLKRRGFEFI
ncbi:DEAD-box ATP-dependent RNA helicase 53, mitochondrial-like protein [Tanacetum coccineum]